MLIAIGIFAYPMFRKTDEDEETSRDDLNKTFYQARVKELEKERNDGIISDEKGMLRDLQRSLLNDVDEVSEIKKTKLGKGMLIPGIIVLIGLAYGMYFTIGGYKKVEHWHNVMAELPQLSQMLASAKNQPLSETQMNDLMLGLRTRLYHEPDDATGWLLLGRLAISARNALEAEGAMMRAYNLEPANPQIANGYAQTLLMINQQGNDVIARQVLLSVLEEEPNNTDTISLLAYDSYSQGHFRQAVDYWKMMKSLLPKNDARLPMLESSIQRAEAQIDPSKTTSNGVVIRIEKSPKVIIPKDGMLLIAAYQANGNNMPVAVKKLPIDTPFPITMTLNDQDSMMPNVKLSSFPEVIIKVRLDRDGNVMTKAGDWFGVSKAVAIGGSTFVDINARYPQADTGTSVKASMTMPVDHPVVNGTPVAAAEQADATLISQGAQLFYTRCTVCHAAPDPSSYTVATWSGIAKSMFPKASLTTQEGNAVLAYLDSKAQQAPKVLT
jgi:cytochrome c-type biogenesis protein CcmI